MSEQPDELRICPHCGQPNSAYTLRCIHCGEELEELFELQGFETSQVPGSEEPEDEMASMDQMLAALDDSPLLEDAEQEDADQPTDEAETEELEPGPGSDTPDWLEKVRQRAKEEQDAAGELAKGGMAMDDRRTKRDREQVDQAFEDIMRRIREQNEREKARRPWRAESDLVDGNGDPEWLRRIRELQPNRAEDTKEIKSHSTGQDDFEDEWTEEELQELLKRELGQVDEPGEGTEEDITTEISTPLPVEIDKGLGEAAELPDQLPKEESQIELDLDNFHNIPVDDDETLTGRPEDEKPLFEAEEKEPGFQPSIGKELGESALQDGELPMPLADKETIFLENEEPDLEEEPEFEEGSEEPETESDLQEEALPRDKDEARDEVEIEDKSEEDNEKLPPENEPVSKEKVFPDLLLLRDQRERAQVLRDIIDQEGRRTLPVLHESDPQGKLGRLVLGLLLILGILISILIGPTGSMDLPLQAHALAFQENLVSLQPGERVLIVMDYQAATRNDIEPSAAKVMQILEENGIQRRVVTANPVNILLANNLLEPAQLPDEYIPGGMLGYLSLAVGSPPNWGELPICLAFDGEPDLFGEIDQVILISDSADFVRMWLEQVSPWRSGIKTSAITTAVSGPMLLPYHDSGQLQGFVAGVADAKVLKVEPQDLVNQRAWQVGMMLMMVVFLLGMLTKADQDSLHRTEGRNR